ncbi:MAG: hypothetical protein K9J13_10100 [Saprospiraceae bacterium]|nr:hypothetical protein [Saprospiraceae bacterium]
MNKFLIQLSLIFIINSSYSQEIEKLYINRDYNKLIEYEDKADELTKDECYYIGYAFFQLANDKKSIKMYDKAIEKGMDDDIIYLYKGLALRYDNQFDEAIEIFRIAIQRNPNGQKNYTELANSFFYTKRYDSALYYFYKARALEFELGDPYFKIPYIYHLQDKFDKALEEYRISASLIDKNDSIYVELLKNIGLLEYAHTKNYSNSIKAYSEMLSIIPTEYDLYAKLIKACYANGDFEKGDSVFNILRIKHEHKELPKEMMEVRGETVDQFMWNGQRVSAMKYYKTPEKFAEPIYQFFLIDKTGTKVEKKFLTEKTFGLDNTKHLLCGVDKATGTHYTYPIGWKSDEIDYGKLKEYVIMILNDELKPQASSNFGTGSGKKKKRKRK